MSRPLNSTARGTLRRSIPAALVCAYVLLLFPPWQFAVPGTGLDASWVEVIGHGARHGWQWGRDVVFTYGPLGYLLPNPYLEGGVALALVLNTCLALVFAQGVVAVLPRHPLFAAIALFVLILFPAAMMGRAAYTVLGLLVTLLHFRQPGDPARFSSLTMAAAAGLFALVYVSSGVLGLAVFLILDLSRLAHRRRPIFVLVFVAAFVLGYLIAGQHLGNLATFLRGSLELISGYSGAMSAVGNRLELAAFVPVSAAALGTIVWCERASFRQRERRLDGLLLLAALGFYSFVAFKSGFVRHDLHSVNAWQALAILLAGYAAVRWHAPGSSRVRWFLGAFSFAACTVSVFAAEQGVQASSVARYASRVLVRQPALALRDVAAAAINPVAWNDAALERRLRGLAAIRAATPLPAVDGSVDVIPNIQSAVLAHGLTYHPRPVFQDYAAYTPWLTDLNRAHYRSPEAAQYVFFSPSTMDNRYPLMDEATTANELLTLYDPLAIEHDLLVLKRRDKPLQARLTNATESTAMFGQWVSMESVTAPMMLSVTLSPNVLGHLAAFLFRPPILHLTVRLANGNEQEYRLVEGIARSGFLLSPLIETPLEFAATATDTWAVVEGLRVVAFRIDTLSESGRRFYVNQIKYTSALLQLDADAARARVADRLRVEFRRQQVTHTMAALSSRKRPFVIARGTELFAHAPVRLDLPVQSAARVSARFALQAGAWSQDAATATDGVCFRIFEVTQNGTRRRLFERCLDPVTHSEDRPEQTAEIGAGLSTPGTLVFETDCRANCNSDWSYWKDIDVEP